MTEKKDPLNSAFLDGGIAGGNPQGVESERTLGHFGPSSSHSSLRSIQPNPGKYDVRNILWLSHAYRLSPLSFHDDTHLPTHLSRASDDCGPLACESS
jgi:hypothetical protein